MIKIIDLCLTGLTYKHIRLCHPMSHTHLKLDTLVNYFIFQCFVTLTMKLLIETLVPTLSFFHGEDFPPMHAHSGQ